jgi:hypothetical protein
MPRDRRRETVKGKRLVVVVGAALVVGMAGNDVSLFARLPGPRPAVAIVAAVDLDGKHYEFTGTGECRASQDSSIYGRPAAQWGASFEATKGALSHLNLTVWIPAKGGAAEVTFSARAGATSFDVSTVNGGTIRGRASGRVERQGAAGTLVVEGVTASGKTVKASVRCARFDAPEDNG